MSSILSFFTAVGKILSSLLLGVTQLLLNIPAAMNMLTYSLAALPHVLTTFAAAFITVSVVYLIIGR